MKVQKYEITRVIDKMKSIVQKNDAFPALGGILVKKGYAIASNTEITMKVKLEACKEDCFIIPMKAFDLIKNLPEELIDISEGDGNAVIIKTGNIKNKFQSYPAENFSFDVDSMDDAEKITLNGKSTMEALGHVMFAAMDVSANQMMTGVNLKGTGKEIKLAALDGHVAAVDVILAENSENIDFTVPKSAVKKLVSMGIIDDIDLSYNKNAAIFQTNEYVIYTRLLNGTFFPYEKMFMDTKIHTYALRGDLIGAITRAKMCAEDNKPAVLKFEGDVLSVSVASSTSDYCENISLQECVTETLEIGFSSKVLLDTIKAFTCENIAINLNAPKFPMMIKSEDSDMKAVVCPVVLR